MLRKFTFDFNQIIKCLESQNHTDLIFSNDCRSNEVISYPNNNDLYHNIVPFFVNSVHTLY